MTREKRFAKTPGRFNSAIRDRLQILSLMISGFITYELQVVSYEL